MVNFKNNKMQKTFEDIDEARRFTKSGIPDKRITHGRTRPHFKSKRWHRLNLIARPFWWCDICGISLLNPHSILVHQGKHCEEKRLQENLLKYPEPEYHI